MAPTYTASCGSIVCASVASAIERYCAQSTRFSTVLDSGTSVLAGSKYKVLHTKPKLAWRTRQQMNSLEHVTRSVVEFYHCRCTAHA